MTIVKGPFSLKEFFSPLTFFLFTLVFSTSRAQAIRNCAEVLAGSVPSFSFTVRPSRRQSVVESPVKRFLSKERIDVNELSQHAALNVMNVAEFRFIRELAESMGLRVWMFGGTAASYLHYVKLDLLRRNGQSDLQANRFDFDFSNIFRMTQDLDLVVDGPLDQVEKFRRKVIGQYKYLVGTRKAWEVRNLRHSEGNPEEGYYKEALLNDKNFSDQNTDSNSIGMVEITKGSDSIVRGLRDWNEQVSDFAKDVLSGTVSYYRSPQHKKTARALRGENPEILSVLRALVKSFQFGSKINPNSMKEFMEVIREFKPQLITNPIALSKINEVAAKLILHASDVEYAFDTLDRLGLRETLLSMNLPSDATFNATYWLQKEPLRSFEIPENGGITELPRYQSGDLKDKFQFKATGKTAKDLDLKYVSHETKSIYMDEAIRRGHRGYPNALISRSSREDLGETAYFGDGFYVTKGSVGGSVENAGFTLRYEIVENAREGVDFILHDNEGRWDIIILNKKALKLIPELLNIDLDQLIENVESGRIKLKTGDGSIAEYYKRRLNEDRLIEEFKKLKESKNSKSQDKFQKMLFSILKSPTLQSFLSDTALAGLIAYASDLGFSRLAPFTKAKRAILKNAWTQVEHNSYPTSGTRVRDPRLVHALLKTAVDTEDVIAVISSENIYIDSYERREYKFFDLIQDVLDRDFKRLSESKSDEDKKKLLRIFYELYHNSDFFELLNPRELVKGIYSLFQSGLFGQDPFNAKKIELVEIVLMANDYKMATQILKSFFTDAEVMALIASGHPLLFNLGHFNPETIAFGQHLNTRVIDFFSGLKVDEPKVHLKAQHTLKLLLSTDSLIYYETFNSVTLKLLESGLLYSDLFKPYADTLLDFILNKSQEKVAAQVITRYLSGEELIRLIRSGTINFHRRYEAKDKALQIVVLEKVKSHLIALSFATDQGQAERIKELIPALANLVYDHGSFFNTIETDFVKNIFMNLAQTEIYRNGKLNSVAKYLIEFSQKNNFKDLEMILISNRSKKADSSLNKKMLSIDSKMHPSLEFFRAVEAGNLGFIQNYIKNNRIDINSYNPQGDTALLSAIRNRQVAVVRELLEHPDINPLIKSSGSSRDSALDIIGDSTDRRLQEIEKLILTSPRFESNSANLAQLFKLLNKAILSKDHAKAKILLNVKNIDLSSSESFVYSSGSGSQSNSRQLTPLQGAIFTRQKQIARLIVESNLNFGVNTLGASYIATYNDSIWKPAVFFALEAGWIDIAIAIARSPGFDKNVRGNGETILSAAEKTKGAKKLVEALLALPKSPLEQ